MLGRDLHLRAGMRVGLLGGSFDPPHAAHLHISVTALRRFDLDRVLWLVSPGNPLKPVPPAPIAQRITAARAMSDDPAILVSDFESQSGTRYTAETLALLRRRFPAVRFTWLMGADNLAGFHRWERWQEILQTVPVGVLARPGDRLSARLSPAAQVFRAARLRDAQSRLLSAAVAPAWCFVNLPMRDDSSTALRRSGAWPQ